ncbi:glutathione synthase [Gynuella sunshinyii]|uniref:Glutathione synthetase n=1 Tax=Gynuella sunshinyii YC6258 TaxID=1445510 RepID=A0A0C5VFU9_9GAMM|nr:glutathione synthase [Gynuella sunshinyii]AJQ93472.1 glutathione synthase/Ribosomal protein S6 modification enzyme (glutaminyl transferase) [Gynuella sunshinyii YC6258]
MTVAVGIVMDPIHTINYKKDSSLAMLWAAQEKGWQLYYMEQSDLCIDEGLPVANMAELSVSHDPDNFYTLGDKQKKPISDLDVVLMRKDPPFDPEYIYSTYILELAEKSGTLIVNKPQSLRDCNEKIFATHFPHCCPPLLVSKNHTQLKEFHQKHKDVIFKPLDGMGGTSIFRAKEDDPNVSVILETLTQYGRSLIMAQRYIPEIVNGDKRILMIDGEPVPYCLARIPPQGETRGNLAAGGRGEARPLTERDLWIAKQIGPTLKQKGLLFVGLDVIGDYLTEINVTSPTCIREIDKAYNTNIAGMLMQVIESKLNRKSQ